MTARLSPHETERVFAHFLPHFKPSEHGHYRGPATYRGGDNPTALVIDAEQGVFFDHATGEGGDAITFVMRALDTDFVGECRTVAGIIGRSLLDDRERPRQPRYSDADLAQAELFRAGLVWHVERELRRHKEVMWSALEMHDDGGQAEPIRRLTKFLAELAGWTAYQSAEALTDFRKRQPALAHECIAEARETQILLAAIVASLSQRKAATR